MKKSLLLTNFVFLTLLLASCQNARKTKSETITETKPIINGTVSTKDSTKAANQTTTSGTVGAGNGISKDTTSRPVNGNAIIHPLPNQEKIDSIKNTKKKIKK